MTMATSSLVMIDEGEDFLTSRPWILDYMVQNVIHELSIETICM